MGTCKGCKKKKMIGAKGMCAECAGKKK